MFKSKTEEEVAKKATAFIPLAKKEKKERDGSWYIPKKGKAGTTWKKLAGSAHRS